MHLEFKINVVNTLKEIRKDVKNMKKNFKVASKNQVEILSMKYVVVKINRYKIALIAGWKQLKSKFMKWKTRLKNLPKKQQWMIKRENIY